MALASVTACSAMSCPSYINRDPAKKTDHIPHPTHVSRTDIAWAPSGCRFPLRSLIERWIQRAIASRIAHAIPTTPTMDVYATMSGTYYRELGGSTDRSEEHTSELQSRQ